MPPKDSLSGIEIVPHNNKGGVLDDAALSEFAFSQQGYIFFQILRQATGKKLRHLGQMGKTWDVKK